MSMVTSHSRSSTLIQKTREDMFAEPPMSWEKIKLKLTSSVDLSHIFSEILIV